MSAVLVGGQRNGKRSVKKRTNRLCLYKLKHSGVFDELDPTASGYSLEHDDEYTKVFVQSGRESAPHWLPFVASLISSPKENIRNTNCSFLLLRKRHGAAYAVTGGYAHNILGGATVDDFGIQVALRILDDDQSISAISQRSMKGATRQLLRAVAGYDPQLDRDNYNRVLKSLEGKATFEGRRFSVKGRESLVLRTSRSVSELDDVIDDVEEVLAQQPTVAFPRSYEEVTDAANIALLDASVERDFIAFWEGTGTRDDIYLEFKDPLVQFRCEDFEVRWDRKTYRSSDFDLGRIRDGLVQKGTRSPRSLADLKKMRAFGFNEHGYQEFGPEPFLRMLICETSLADGVACIRLGGKWLRILDELQTFLNDELGKIHVYSGLLPDWELAKYPKELGYNRYAAQRLGWHCLDQVLVQVDSRSKIELCDLYSPADRRFVHVKKIWGAKAAYLFAQGLVASEFYSNSSDFRQACASKWPAFLGSQVEDAEVVFAIANSNALSSAFPLNLSYFAKLSLYDACTRLRALGYRVALTAVAIDP